MQEAPKDNLIKQADILRIEKALEESEERYRTLVEQSPDNVVIHDLEGKILFTNASRVEVLGANSPEEVIGRNAMELVHPDDREFVQKTIGEALEDYKNNNFSVKTIEHRLIRFDGTEFYGEATGVPFIYKGELAIQTIVRDITARKEAQEELKELNDTLEKRVRERTTRLLKANVLLKHEIAEREKVEGQKEKIQSQLFQAQKMEAIGTLAGGIAHDFNNIMTSIKNMSSLALKRVEDNDPARECIEPLIEISKWGADLVKQLLVYSRNEPFEIRSYSLKDIVGDLLPMLDSLVGEKVVIERSLEEGLWKVETDRVRMEQVLTNLVVNSSNAMTRGGTITISAENIKSEDPRQGFEGTSPLDGYISLKIEDNGEGMDKDTLARIFEPFFTTNSPSGTGLGLSVVYGIVKELDGLIDVSSEPGKGTAITISLPASSGPAEAVL